MKFVESGRGFRIAGLKVAILAAAVLALGVGVWPGSAVAQDVSVGRGSTVESGVVVSRGGSRQATLEVGASSAYPPTPRAAQLETRRYVPVAGQGGWFIDTELNRIGKCYRVNTTQTGRSRIRCTWNRIE